MRGADWQSQAACANLIVDKDDSEKVADTIELFFSKYELDANVAQSVDVLCVEKCPVRRQCAQMALDNKATGVHGGIYWVLGKPNKAKNSHKTPELFDKLKEDYGV